MKFKRPIYRYLFFAAWIAVLGGIATLVIAANSKSKSRTCKGVAVSINGEGDKIYVEKDDVLQIIEKTARGPVVKKPFAALNLGALEKSLEASPWIRDAELYLDTKDVLHVSVWERQPFARVFTTAGTSFYIDSSGYQLPLLEGYSARLPVVTGFPAAKKLNARDSLTLQGLKQVVSVIVADPFWSAQVGQIDITPERKFELVPVIGSHVIKLGFAENVEQKLKNLLVFYKQVLPKAGLAKYSTLDVQFEGQVVAALRGQVSAVDSIQLQKNIEELMKKKEAEQEPDDASAAVPVVASAGSVSDSAFIQTKAVEKPVATTTVSSNTIPRKPGTPSSNPVKNEAKKSNPQKPVKKTAKSSKPKAVMPAKAGNVH